MPPKVNPEEILIDLQQLATRLGRAPLATEYERLGKFSSATVRKYFGNWGKALDKAGIKKSPMNRIRWSDEEIEEELNRLATELGHFPSYSEVKRFGRISPDTIHRRKGRTTLVNPRELPLSEDWSVDKIPPELGHWIAGFTTGEGSFILNRGNVEFRIGLRADDSEILEFIREIMDIPQPVRKYSNSKRREKGEKAGDEARLSVPNRQVLRLRVIPFFDRFPVRGRKALEYRIFREAVLFLSKRDDEGRFHQRFTPEELEVLNRLTKAIKAIRYALPLSN